MTASEPTHTCPECGQPATGNFCQNCGAEQGGRFCSQCGEGVPSGSNFCNHCGAAVGGGARPDVTRGVPASGVAANAPRGRARAGAGVTDGSLDRGAAAREVVTGQNLPWWIAGISMFGLILFVGLSMVRPGAGPVPSTSGPVPAGGAAAGGGVAPDISNMSPLEAADRLFNRVMQATSAGDSAQAQAFVPMAIAAYQRARPLNLDGLFHLSMLNRTAMNLEAALDVALEIIEQDPNHLLGLAAAAEAAIELGELDEAETHYRQLLAVYDDEVLRALPEYGQHSRIVEVLKQDAERFLAGR